MMSRSDLLACRPSLAAFVVVGIGWGGYAALVPVLKDQIAASDSAYGLALFVAAFGAATAMALAPMLDRRLGARAMLILALAHSVVFLLPTFVGGVAGFALAMLCCAAISGTLDVIMNARLSEVEAARGRSLMNFAHAVFSLSYAAAAVLAGVAREIGMTPVPIMLGLSVISLGFALATREDRHSMSAAAHGVPDRLPGRLIWLTGGIILIGFMAEQATEGWSALRLERDLGAGALQGAFGPAILGLTMGIGRLMGQVLADRIHALTLIALASALAAAGAALTYVATSLPPAYLGFAALGFGVSIVAPTAFAYVGARIKDNQRMTAIARISVIGYAGFFIGPPVMGHLAEGYGLGTAFGFVALALLVIVVALVPALFKQERVTHAH